MKSVVTVSFSIEPELNRAARAHAKLEGYTYSYSAWLRKLILEKIQCLPKENLPHPVKSNEPR